MLKIGNLLFLLGMCGCAAVSSPGGGPVDETPPAFISAEPEAGSLHFEGGPVVLMFSEYIDEKSLKNAVKVSPRLNSPVEIQYADEEIILDFPQDLLSNQTYVITISRNLKDERGVALNQSIQVAYSTGSVIDEGQISGRVHGEDSYAIHLWKLEEGWEDSVFFTEPMYVSEADDDGYFNFKYLAQGDYAVMGIERSAAGASLVPQRMAHGVSSEKMYTLGENEELKGIPLRPKREMPPLKMTHAELKGQQWGWVHFNQELENDIILDGLTIVDSEQNVHTLDFYQDVQDQKRFLLISPDTLLAGKAELRLNTLLSDKDTLLTDAKINVRVPSKVDTTHIKLIKPESAVTIRLEKDGGPVVPIVFSKPIISVSDSAFFMVADTDTVVTDVHWVNPTEIAFLPPGGWQEKTQYKLMIFSNKLTPIIGKTLKDSISYVSMKSEKKLGYGGLSGTFEKDGFISLLELRRMKKESEIFHSSVNSDHQFYFKNIPEGPYRLMIIDDRDRNGEYSYGSAYPFQPSEWFYIHPDTFDVRANWDIDVGSIRIGGQ
ncbi:Ig-like domain-containing protein [Caldithrix abyssi]|nr:Ig-like domain-containing protein [Caldithrix abyssi]